MSKLKRYKVENCINCDDHPVVYENPHGRYVLASDVEEMERENAELRERLAAFGLRYSNKGVDGGEVDRLRAEVAVLREFYEAETAHVRWDIGDTLERFLDAREAIEAFDRERKERERGD